MIVVSAPSGAGKTTLVKYLLSKIPNLGFSVSATSRPQRNKEVNGKDYHFFSKNSFEDKIRNEEFIEYEEVYPGVYYGTLRSEVEKLLNDNKIVVYDIDAIGGLNIKKLYPDKTLAIFIKPPTIKDLKERLIKRKTDSIKEIENRLSKSKFEISLAKQYDEIIINDNLESSKIKIEEIVSEFIFS
ncbi:MAG: guanylate kinase [Flavobacteriaceae bacterium]|nr:guanylate kinase [Flavobacteriaceae bacterium]